MGEFIVTGTMLNLKSIILDNSVIFVVIIFSAGRPT